MNVPDLPELPAPPKPPASPALSQYSARLGSSSPLQPPSSAQAPSPLQSPSSHQSPGEPEQRRSFWDDDLPVRSALPSIDSSTPHPYRMHNFLVGGKDNFQIDRDAVAELLKTRPDTAITARAIESFCARAVIELSRAGLRQFVQIGSAISVLRSHDGVARAQAPDTKFVYVAEDPITLIHARAVLADEHVAVIGGDFRDPARMLAEPVLNELIDLDQPCAFLLFGLLDFIADDRKARAALETVYARAAPGSHLAFLHVLDTGSGPGDRSAKVAKMREEIQVTPRYVLEIEKIVEGFELWEQDGLVPVTNWRPVLDEKGPGPDMAARAGAVGGVIIKR